MTLGDEMAARLAAEGLDASGWGNEPSETYAAHSHPYDKVLVATFGSITFHLTDIGRNVTLSAGERLDLPAGTMHAATVGGDGVQCLEAHLPAGSLPVDPRHLAQGW